MTNPVSLLVFGYWVGLGIGWLMWGRHLKFQRKLIDDFAKNVELIAKRKTPP